MFDRLRAQIGERNVYDLVKDHGPEKGLRENQHEKNLRIIGEYYYLLVLMKFIFIFL